MTADVCPASGSSLVHHEWCVFTRVFLFPSFLDIVVIYTVDIYMACLL